MGKRANNEGSVYYDAGRRKWVAQVQIGLLPSGRARYKRSVHARQGEAERAKRAMLDALDQGRTLDEKPTTAAAYPGERVVLVVDNAGWHTARDLAVPANVILWFLPPHLPELNPVEQVWQWLREHHTRGALFATHEELVTALCAGLTALMDDPARVRSLTARADEDPRLSA